MGLIRMEECVGCNFMLDHNGLEAENKKLKEILEGYQDCGFWGRTASRLQDKNKKLREALELIRDDNNSDDRDDLDCNECPEVMKENCNDITCGQYIAAKALMEDSVEVVTKGDNCDNYIQKMVE